MATLLHVAASPRNEDSHSRQAAEIVIRHWLSLKPDLRTVSRDLAENPVPHPDADFARASLAKPGCRSDAERSLLRLSDTLIDELTTADAVLISMPMHNFSVPSVLKAWIDQVVRPGCTFRSTNKGKQGLLTDRPVRVIMACGGNLSGESSRQEDWAIPYLRYVFAVIGINDFQAYRLERCSSRYHSAEHVRGEIAAWLSQHIYAI